MEFLKYSKHILELTVAVFLIVAMLFLANAGRRVNTILEHADSAISNVDRTTDRARAYLDFQTDLLQTPSYQKSLKASLQAPAVANGTFRLINTQLVPRAVKTLDSLNAALGGLSQSTDSLNRLIIGLDRNVNSGLLPASTALITNLNETARRFGVTVEELNQAIKLSSQQLNVTLQAMQDIIGDPEWRAIIHNLNRISESAADSMAQAPSIAASLEKIARTSSKFSRITLIANIVSTLARAFLP